MRFPKSYYSFKNPNATCLVIEEGKIEEIEKILKKVDIKIPVGIAADYITGATLIAINRENFHISWYTRLGVHDYDYDNEYISLPQLRQIVKNCSQ